MSSIRAYDMMHLAITISARQDAFRNATFIEEIARAAAFIAKSSENLSGR